MSPRLTRATVLLALALAPLTSASAQVTTIDFSAHGGAAYDPIAQTFGDHANLDVTYQTRATFGNAAQICTSTSYWPGGYSNLSAVTFACGDGYVGEMFFQPLNGNSVFLASLDIGSFPSTNGVGPTRAYTLGVYDTGWNLLYSSIGTVDATLTLTPNVSSSSGLYLQWGTDWDTGLNNITTDVNSSAVVATPEPSSVVLLATGIVGIAGFARRRRKAA